MTIVEDIKLTNFILLNFIPKTPYQILIFNKISLPNSYAYFKNQFFGDQVKWLFHYFDVVFFRVLKVLNFLR